MYITNNYCPIHIGRQFILKENETTGKLELNKITLQDSNGNDVTDYEIYDLYPEGKKYIGCFGFKGSFWYNWYEKLVENNRYSVTFYNESYTRSMIPDWIEGTMGNLIIAYDRIYKLFAKDYNITDSTTSVTLSNTFISQYTTTWRKFLSYKTGFLRIRGDDAINFDDTGWNTEYHKSLYSNPYLCYPFIILKCPELLKKIYNLGPGNSIKFLHPVEIRDRGPYDSSSTYFPNVDIEKFNILLPNTINS